MEKSNLGSSDRKTYQDSLDYLYGLQKFGIKFGLNSTTRILEKIGDPHQGLRCIHVAGTNGKGSTAAMLSSVLCRCGFRTGLYTSPHLVRFTERFRIDDREVSVRRILDVFQKIRRVLDEAEPPTFFEMVTAMGLLYFAEEKVDWAVMEVGMGGRLDATNVITPKVSVITNVSLEHQEYLGNTVAAIAREKAGIVKNGVPVITGVSQPTALGVVKAECLRREAPLYCLGKDFRVRRNSDLTFRYKGMRHHCPSLGLNLVGRHQVRNAALALASLEALDRDGHVAWNPAAIAKGLASVHWPARLEILDRQPLVILDGAHNPSGAEALKRAIEEDFAHRRVHLVLGIMADKDIAGMLKRLLPIADTAVFTQPRYARAANPERLRELAGPYLKHYEIISEPALAIERARSLAGPDDLICITGSLYFAGEVKEIFGEAVAEI